MLYFENDLRVASPPLLEFAMKTLGYDLYWHLAPVFDEHNYFGNATNHWAPKSLVSPMVLGVPAERDLKLPTLARVAGADDWWDKSS